MKVHWEDGFEIRVDIRDDKVTISANEEGLRSLAGQLTALAEAAPGSHIHYDKYNSLEEGSGEMIIEKTEEMIIEKTEEMIIEKAEEKFIGKGE